VNISFVEILYLNYELCIQHYELILRSDNAALIRVDPWTKMKRHYLVASCTIIKKIIAVR